MVTLGFPFRGREKATIGFERGDSPPTSKKHQSLGFMRGDHLQGRKQSGWDLVRDNMPQASLRLETVGNFDRLRTPWGGENHWGGGRFAS